MDDISLEAIADCIDWTFFFSAWELKGRFPKILDHPRYGEAARELFAHGRELLARIIDEKLLTPRGVYGFWPAASQGDDIVLFGDASRGRELVPARVLGARCGRRRDGRSQRSPAAVR